jgi:hypothetical protein
MITYKATAVLIQERVGLQQSMDHIIVLLGSRIPVCHKEDLFHFEEPTFKMSLNYAHFFPSLSI